MRWKSAFVIGGVVGYVLGAKAGRERYEQIVRFTRKVGESPTVQEAIGVVQAQAGKLATTSKDTVKRVFRNSDLEGDFESQFLSGTTHNSGSGWTPDLD